MIGKDSYELLVSIVLLLPLSAMAAVLVTGDNDAFERCFLGEFVLAFPIVEWKKRTTLSDEM
jgi:hypothetical protein